MIRYERFPELDARIQEIAMKLDMGHIDLSRVVCVRSTGSKSRYTLARCHTLSKIIQKALDVKAHYIIEIISENFDRLSEEEKTKTLIHELMHIPHSFSGGFRHHRPHVNRKAIDHMYRDYLNARVEY